MPGSTCSMIMLYQPSSEGRSLTLKEGLFDLDTWQAYPDLHRRVIMTDNPPPSHSASRSHSQVDPVSDAAWTSIGQASGAPPTEKTHGSESSSEGNSPAPPDTPPERRRRLRVAVDWSLVPGIDTIPRGTVSVPSTRFVINDTRSAWADKTSTALLPGQGTTSYAHWVTLN